jgi:hypothetical protein
MGMHLPVIMMYNEYLCEKLEAPDEGPVLSVCLPPALPAHIPGQLKAHLPFQVV